MYARSIAYACSRSVGDMRQMCWIGIVDAEDVATDHLDVGHHRLQVLAGAHGVAEAPLEGPEFMIATVPAAR